MNKLMFSSLPDPKSRLHYYVASWGTQGLLAAAFFLFTLLVPQVLPAVVQELPISLVPYDPPAPVVAHFTPHTMTPVFTEARLVVPRPTSRVTQVPEETVSAPVLTVKSPAPDVTAHPVIPQTVHVGGFGDPNGVPTHAGKGQVNINVAGAFSAAAGSGNSGKPSGTVVASSGFGTVESGGNPVRRQAVVASGFDVPVAARTKMISVVESRTTGVTILSKPIPVYTAEGRKLGIEGLVHIQVRFMTDGRVQIVRVVSGLGHGLDEEAVRAVQQIKFKPALRDGLPAESEATLAVVFQLAS